MSQIMLHEDEAARTAFLSRLFSSKGRFYRTWPPRAFVDSETPNTTLNSFISVFNSSHICRVTLKNRLRQIIIQGASKAWNPSSHSISPRNLFKDFNPADPASRLSSDTSLSTSHSPLSVEASLSTFLSDSATLSSTATRSAISELSTSEAEMGFKFKCDECKKLQKKEERKRGATAGEKSWGGMLERCPTCTTIMGAIAKLTALVFREPWLETEGMAGAPEKAAWEKEGERAGWDQTAVGGVVVVDDDDDGYTKVQGDRVRRQAEEAVMRRWGLMVAEQAAEEEADRAE